MKKLPMTTLLAALMLLLAPGVVGWASQAPAPRGKPRIVTSLFKVEGMTCGGCEAGVRITVKKLAGVDKVEASYEKGQASVTYNPEIVTPQRIIEVIKELGYSAELIRSEG